ncbi:hypothetical protein ILYODFUR_035612 [Ilyodon furcidens]|uniref:Secreted protein n=1 Tax=Ilyodon furcidens TaxID=33524 RepID=A0ABV0TTA0_9TELE
MAASKNILVRWQCFISFCFSGFTPTAEDECFGFSSGFPLAITECTSYSSLCSLCSGSVKGQSSSAVQDVKQATLDRLFRHFQHISRSQDNHLTETRMRTCRERKKGFLIDSRVNQRRLPSQQLLPWQTN